MFASVPRSPPPSHTSVDAPTPETLSAFQPFEEVSHITAPGQTSEAEPILPPQRSITPAAPYVEHEHGDSIRYETASSFDTVWGDLRLSLTLIWGADSVADNLKTCIDLYVRHLFPLTPLVDERALRTVVRRVQSDAIGPETCSIGKTLSTHQAFPVADLDFAAPTVWEEPVASKDPAFGLLVVERSLTLLIALCATVSSLLPAVMMPPSLKASDNCLLQGSRRMLHTFQDEDIEQPCAMSVVIRYLHSMSAHAAGQLRVSWYILGEAIRMAQDLRVYDESSFSGLPLREVHLRRSLFWQLTTGDRSSAILNNKPSAFRSSGFDQPFSTKPLPLDYDCLLDQVLYRDTRQLTILVNTGFNIVAMLFKHTAKILVTLKSLEEQSHNLDNVPELVRVHKGTITKSLSELQGVIDDLPDWIQRPWTFAAVNGRHWEDLGHESCYIWILYTNIMLTYHCLQMILLKRASGIGQVETLGYSTDPTLRGLHTLRIAQNALQVIRNSPFEALQVNGEPLVSRRSHHKRMHAWVPDFFNR